MPKAQRKKKHAARPTLIVSFGDVFLLDEYLKKSGFHKVIDAIRYRNPDTLHALLAFYILTSYAGCHAQDWWELTYAKYLYPKARMAPQRISEALADIGSEDAKRSFFREYFRFLDQCPDFHKTKSLRGIDDGILIDSSGLPNAILDAGYYTGANADVLLDAGISFMARMKSSFKVYQDTLNKHLKNLESKGNAVLFNKRLVYIKCVPCKIGQKGKRPAYAYLCKEFITTESVKKMNDAYKAFKVQCPATILR